MTINCKEEYCVKTAWRIGIGWEVGLVELFYLIYVEFMVFYELRPFFVCLSCFWEKVLVDFLGFSSFEEAVCVTLNLWVYACFRVQ